MALQTFGTNVTMSLSDINVELGESVTEMIDFLGAATSFSGILDTETTDGFGAGAVEMREFYGKTFSAGSGTYGTRNAHTFFFAWTNSELIQAAQNNSPDSTATYYVDDYIDNSLTNGDDVFLTETGTSKLDGGDNFYLSTTANEIGQISSTGELSNVRSRTPDTPTISQNSVSTDSITINIQGNTQVTNTYRIYVDSVSNSTKTDHTKGALANTDVTTTHTITGLNDDTIYAIKVRGENTFANGSDSNTINVSTDTITPPAITFNDPTTGTGGEGLIDLTWSVTSAATITDFKVEQSTNSDMSSATTLTTTNDGSEQYNVSGQAGNLIYFRITATNDGGTTVSAIKSARASQSPTISSFTAVSGTGGVGLIDLNWSVDNGYPNSLTSFTLEQSANFDMSSATEATPTNDGTHQYNVSGNAGNTVYFRITATNAAGTTVSSIINAVASSKPTINSFTGARSETVAQAIDLNWSTTAGTAATTAFSITRGTTLANAIGGTSVTTTDDSTEQVGSLGFGQSYFFYMTITNANGTSVLYANSGTAITTRPAPTIDTFIVAGGTAANSIDITYATSNADTVTLKEDNTTDGTYETTILNNSATVDGSQTRTGLTPGNLHTYQLTATGAGSVVTSDNAFPTAPTSWTNSVGTISLQSTTGNFNNQDFVFSTINNITVVNPIGDTSIVCSQTGIDGASLDVRWADNSGMSGASSYANSHTNIPSSVTTIYYQVRWTEYDPTGPEPLEQSHAASFDPINVARSNQFTWTNNSVTEQQDLDLDFYNSVGTDPPSGP